MCLDPQIETMNRRLRQRGFTLIELMVVISIIVILMSVAIPRYQSSILRARETVLRDDLYTLRSVIDQYTLDKQKAPQSLQELSMRDTSSSFPGIPSRTRAPVGCL